MVPTARHANHRLFATRRPRLPPIDPTLARIGAARGCSAAAVALAWTVRTGKVIAIPESGAVTHVQENAVALSLTLLPEELDTLDAAYPMSSR